MADKKPPTKPKSARFGGRLDRNHPHYAQRNRNPEGGWRAKLRWALKEGIGTVLSAAEVQQLVKEFDSIVEVLKETPK